MQTSSHATPSSPLTRGLHTGFRWLQGKFELSRGDAAHNVRPMEGMRGFAVFLVFLVHYVALMEPWFRRDSLLGEIANGMQIIGHSGVDLFFVLSGYLIYGSLISRPQPFPGFMRRRIQRIYPVFTVVFLVYVALSFVFPGESKIPAGFADAAIYLLQNFLLLPGIFDIEAMITVAWSLSYEMLYYLAIPLLITALAMRSRGRQWRMGFFLALSLVIALYCAIHGGHARLLMFLSGILLFEALADTRTFRAGSIAGALALAAGVASRLLPTEGHAGDVLKISILFAAFFVFCYACFRHRNNALARAFSWTPLRWLGNMSYSYYLLHGLALKAGFLVLSKVLPASDQGPVFFAVLLPLMFLLTLLPTAALFIAVERPYSLAPRKTSRAATQAEAGTLPADGEPGIRRPVDNPQRDHP